MLLWSFPVMLMIGITLSLIFGGVELRPAGSDGGISSIAGVV